MPDLTAPGTVPERYWTLDVIRGVAVLGILGMNIVGFAMPDAAYDNPRAFGTAGPLDWTVWALSFVLIDGKMRGLFSFLFGASLLLVTERAEAAGRSPARAHYTRMGWLLVFGLAHLFLVWWGDILAHYALVGMIAYPFRRIEAHKLATLGSLLVLVQFGLMAMLPLGLPGLLAAAHSASPSPEAVAALQSLTDQYGIPDTTTLAHEIAIHRAGYATILADRLPFAEAAPGIALRFLGIETLAYILLGMAALRSGMLRGAWPRTWYVRTARIGFGIGLPLYALLALSEVWSGFSLLSVAWCSVALSTLARPAMIGGWAALIMLLAEPGGRITTRLSAAGRMAFSNYLVCSLVCTTLFYGYGLGLYGHMSRAELWLVVATLWAGMLGWSLPWLKRHRYGPFEWLWRSLARRDIQPWRL